MRLFSSLEQKIKDIKDKKINIYLCGPTVYNYIHIGNARPIVIFDVLIRLLIFLKKDYFYVQNLTDIDDKIINTAQENSISENVIATKFIDAYFNDLNKLQVFKPSIFVKVSDYINPMIEFINKLVKKTAAYESNGNVYFNINNYLHKYGQLSKKDINNNITGSRIKIDQNKKNEYDFILWKKTSIGKKWNSYWSLGRPGWHTECAFFINNFFKTEKITIHGGGIDLIFPHHENERIQLYALHEHEPVNIWLHNGHLNWENDKMSKSLGNYIFVKDFLSKYDANTLKYLLLSAPYRKPLNINEQLITSSKKIINSYYQLNKEVLRIALLNQIRLNDFAIDKNLINKIVIHLENDLNIAKAWTEIQNLTKLLKKSLNENDLEQIMILFNTWKQALWLLSIDMSWPEINDQIKDLLIQWQLFKKQQDYKKADQIMQSLIEKGVF